MNKNESKYFNTAQKFDKALLSLLEKKEFEYITIREICEKAGVNRSTFYLHYENTCDLLRETTGYVIDSFLSYFTNDRNSISLNLEECNINELFFITPKYITPYLTFIKDNRQIFKTTLKHFGTMEFDRVYQKMFDNIFSPVLSRFKFPENERAYVMKFYLSGITAIVMEWLENNCSESIENITKIIIDCIMGKIKIEK